MQEFFPRRFRFQANMCFAAVFYVCICIVVSLSPHAEAAQKKPAATNTRKKAASAKEYKPLPIVLEPMDAYEVEPRPYYVISDLPDPDWTPYEESNYIRDLRRALDGDAYAMVRLAYLTRYWGDKTEAAYPQIPQKFHLARFWQEWAARITSPGWALVEEGHLEPDSYGGRRVGLYRLAAEAGSAEGMYLRGMIDSGSYADLCRFLQQSAAMGYGDSLAELGVCYGWGGGACDLPQDAMLMREYLKKAAAAGSIKGLLDVSGEYAIGRGAFSKNFEAAYYYRAIAWKLKKTFEDVELVRGSTEVDTYIARYLAPEQRAPLDAKAKAWVERFTAGYPEMLEKARERRKPILVELRQAMAPVQEYFTQRGVAAQQ